jgi:hypothetical protein
VLKMLNGLSAHIVRSEFVKHIDWSLKYV